jgi:peptidoglycan/LPS O-acetylase OafA/YrhL
MFCRKSTVLSEMRNPSLDMLRAVAVLLVFCYHSEGTKLFFGWIGVDLFFVLSGFLVSGLLFQEYQATHEIQPARFLLRRGLKIYPQFYFFIAATLAVACLQGRAPRIQEIVAELAFVRNYAPGIWGHTWSLDVEEHFYVLLVLVLLMMARRGGTNPFRALPGWIAASCAVILVLRVITWKLHPQITDATSVFPSHLRIDSLLAGVFVSYYHTFHRANISAWMRRAGAWVTPASILLLVPVTFLTREDPFMVTAGFSLESWGFALLLVSVLYPTKPAPAPSRAGRAMVRLGQLSYAFYLWQAPILAAGDGLKLYAQAHGVSTPYALILALAFGATLTMALVTTSLIETPALRWRDRHLPGRGSSIAGVQGGAPECATLPAVNGPAPSNSAGVELS